MSENASGRMRGIAWMLGAVLAIPLLYLLSVPPIAICLYGRGSGNHLGEAMNGSVDWFEHSYTEFWGRCEGNSLLCGPLQAYDEWWWRVTKPR